MAKAGPKAQVTVPPLVFKGWPLDRAKRRIKFIDTYIYNVDDNGKRRKFGLQSFQKEIICGSYADGIRTALVSIPRANGKTMLAAAIAIAEMFLGPRYGEVLCIAAGKEQAGHVLKYAMQLINESDELRDRFQVYADKLVLPENEATLRVLPAEPAALHGYNPSLCIIDELHVVDSKVWSAATSVRGKRRQSLTLAISTPSHTKESVMWKLVEHGRLNADSSFYLREFSAPDGCAVDDRDAWKIANPAMTCERPFQFIDGMASDLATSREDEFRQLRLGQWVASLNAWLPFGAWEDCLDSTRTVRPGERVVLAFDGSASGDSTALVGCTMDGHLWIEGIWENPGNPRWRVPRAEVSNAVDMAFANYNVARLACDPWGWRSEIEAWAAKHGDKRVVEWNTAAASLMAPATDRLYQAVMTKLRSVDGPR
ncbi:terminase large subunit domain-containing protein [Mycolicibacterium sp. J2]|uniref:terminase large subunit domain-containing protein n=1 Tax=Mycolicibacterium sp. J2 TaxID=2993511 RepID=UPI00224B94CE|nr:terminase large subunit [Mycolicibacterium sp. J2]MCX2716087.1 terminase large subunit [Mycolicibacterium sp. J2]